MIYRKNSAYRRARAGTFFFPVSVAGGVQLDITGCRSILLEAEGVADSQFNFMAYTVPPSAAAYRAPSSFLLFLYHPSPSPPHLPAPFKNFSTRHPRNFQITSPFPSSFLKIHPPLHPSHSSPLSCSTNCAMDRASGVIRNAVGETLNL